MRKVALCRIMRWHTFISVYWVKHQRHIKKATMNIYLQDPSRDGEPFFKVCGHHPALDLVQRALSDGKWKESRKHVWYSKRMWTNRQWCVARNQESTVFAVGVDATNAVRMVRRAEPSRRRECLHCGLFSMRDLVWRCSGCKVATYCDRVCQKADWKRHKRYCCRWPSRLD